MSELIPLLPIMDAQSCPGRGWRLERAPAESHSVSARAELPPCPGALSRSPGQHLTEVQVQTSALCDPGRVGDLRQCLLRTLAPATPGADQVTPACVYRVRRHGAVKDTRLVTLGLTQTGSHSLQPRETQEEILR